MEQRSVSPETQAAQGLGEADPASGGLAPVINLSTNYEQQLDGSYPQGRIYTRADNPTSEHAERLLAALEGCACACALFGSGMAAATAVFQSLLPGDHVLVSRVLYWGVRKWLAEFALTWGLDVEFTDTTDLDAVAAAIRPGRTRLLWVETPANPMWDITDLAAVCELGQAAGVRVAVDNTVATPVLTRPFEHGADLVVHSAPRTPDGPRSRKPCSSPRPGCPSRCSPRPCARPRTRPARSACVSVRSTPNCVPVTAARPCWNWRRGPSAACARALRFPGGASLEEIVLANALGRGLPAASRPVRPCGVFMLPVPRPGILRAVEGRASAAAVPGITGLTITIPVGQQVRPLPDGDRYLGFIFAEGDTGNDVQNALTAASEQLQVVIR